MSATPPPASKKFLGLTRGLPLLITVMVHVLLALVAGVIVVQQAYDGKKKTFQAATASDSVAQKQVEHRLQVARRGGASGAASSPVSANRIFSTAQGALTMPEMQDLPSMGAAGFGGFGGMGSGVGLGLGAGAATSLGAGAGLGGRGFMSLTFLGMTNNNVRNVVFVVDVGPELMDLKKGGFRAFEIIRQQVNTLVAGLPPTSNFNVVLFDSKNNWSHNVNQYSAELVPASSENKKSLFAWLAPVNTNYQRLGPQTAAKLISWKPRPFDPGVAIEPIDRLNPTVHALHAALESQPDVVYLITGNLGNSGLRSASAETLRLRRSQASQLADDVARQQVALDKFFADLAKRGITKQAYETARQAAFAKAKREFDAANAKLVAAGKPPVVNMQPWEYERRASELRRAGINIKLDPAGWRVGKDGLPIGEPPVVQRNTVADTENVPWTDIYGRIARLQSALTAKPAVVNTMLFVGPDEKADAEQLVLGQIARRNSGKFQLITTKRLEEISAAQDSG